MAVTKTNFINYSRCPRYVALDEVHQEKLDANITYEEYLLLEKDEYIKELLGSMYESDNVGEEQDLINVVDEQLEVLLPYYKKVEELAGILTEKYFKGKTIYAEYTKNQECFDFSLNGIRYICYVDIYNENEQGINIIEVKATTSKKYAELTYGKRGGEKFPIFTKKDNVYKLNSCIDDEKSYADKINKLKNRYSDIGGYIYDLAVQRFIVEGELRQSNNPNINKVNYYLAVLNHEYVFDGTYEGEEAVYNQTEEGHEIITFIDLNEITKQMQTLVKQDSFNIEKYIMDSSIKEQPLKSYCEKGKRSECKYFKKICSSKIPAVNSSLNYIYNQHGFVINEHGDRLKGLDLINENYLKMLDIPNEWITNPNHQIQRETLMFNKPYINVDKISLGIKQLKYPIYHLDFETFPCPLPRFKGEWPYIQSPFEFSLHIENEPGKCDKEKDNYVFLAKTFKDEREELIKDLIKYINPNDSGTLFAQNVAFEKGRIKELADMFPEYKEDLMKIYDRGFDLIWLLRGSKDNYLNWGLELEEAKKLNYYHPDFSGSYSIKKTLPVFSNLTYQNLEVQNGNEAIVEYASYPKRSKEELILKQQALIDYCQQDTWAMVEILNKLREIVK